MKKINYKIIDESLFNEQLNLKNKKNIFNKKLLKVILLLEKIYD